MPPSALSSVDVADAQSPVHIAVLVVNGDTAEAEAVNVSGPVRTAVRTAFAHPRLAAPLQALQMDADRLVGRIVSRWENTRYGDDGQQLWEKSNGSTTVRWWVDRDDARGPGVRPA